MPTDDAFDIAWDSVHDIEKGLMSDFKDARRAKQKKNALHRANQMKYASRLTQLLRENPQITPDQLRAKLAPEYLPQEAEADPEPAVEEIAPDDDDSDFDGPPITEGRRPPDPPDDAVVPDPAKIVEEQTSEPPGPITDLARLLPAPSERKTEQVSKPPKPPEGAVEPKPDDIVDTTKPLGDEPPTNESELEDFENETKDQKRDKITSESMAADDAWTVVKNPHANPFTDFSSVLAVNEEKPPERSIPVSDPIIMKEETPLQKLREKGFDMNEGDNLSLLPSNTLLNEDMGIQDNTSLLPAGWRNE